MKAQIYNTVSVLTIIFFSRNEFLPQKTRLVSFQEKEFFRKEICACLGLNIDNVCSLVDALDDSGNDLARSELVSVSVSPLHHGVDGLLPHDGGSNLRLLFVRVYVCAVFGGLLPHDGVSTCV